MKGLTLPSLMYPASLGSNFGHRVFIWKIPQGVSLEAATLENMRVINQIKQSLPTYHSHALRRALTDWAGCKWCEASCAGADLS